LRAEFEAAHSSEADVDDQASKWDVLLISEQRLGTGKGTGSNAVGLKLPA
jgi:hypothetical protein